MLDAVIDPPCSRMEVIFPIVLLVIMDQFMPQQGGNGIEQNPAKACTDIVGLFLPGRITAWSPLVQRSFGHRTEFELRRDHVVIARRLDQVLEDLLGHPVLIIRASPPEFIHGGKTPGGIPKGKPALGFFLVTG